MFEEREEYEEVLTWHPYPEDPPLRMDTYLCQHHTGGIVFSRFQNGEFTRWDESVAWWAEMPKGNGESSW